MDRLIYCYSFPITVTIEFVEVLSGNVYVGFQDIYMNIIESVSWNREKPQPFNHSVSGFPRIWVICFEY
ncbi:unnamed protein product, partial [Mesorhabditis belari]|uniref:Uncharacterized protein n=1 Tax=Mesorhabditis belari TaxID=2138241 RepID=A0AAF3EW61_9BILA